MPINRTAPERYLIVSDFHLTSGRNAVTGQWSTTEDFFWDHEFAEFLAHHTDGKRTTLIFNGDLFDFMQILDVPNAAERKEFGISDDDFDRRGELHCTEHAAEFQIARALAGHAGLFEALALFVARDNEVLILKGNHDVQLYWPAVQRRVVAWMTAFSAEHRMPFDPGRVQFLPWCYYHPGVLFVEHGNQYEPTTSYRNLFLPLLPLDLPHGRAQLDLDVSGFLVRYITNPVERYDPLADNVRPLSRFYAYLWKKHPWVAARAFASAATFVFMARRKRRLWKRTAIRRRYAEICRLNAAAMKEEARRWSGDFPEEAGRIAGLFQTIRTRHHQRTAWERRVWPFLRKRRNFLPNASRMLRHRAEKLATILNARYIVFGHSHSADDVRLSKSTRYFNTGTWIPTFSEAAPDAPDQLQFTFVRLEGGEGGLFRWDPVRRVPDPVTFH